MQRLMRVVAAFAVATLIACAYAVAGAHAHGESATRGLYVSEVTGISGDIPGDVVHASILEGDDQIRIRNTGTEVLVVEAYKKGTPFVRIAPGGVFLNANTSDYYVNEDRYSGEQAPKGVGIGAAEWKRVAGAGTDQWSYHDHRIHWMLRTPPPQIDESRAERQKVFDWAIPIQYGDAHGEITGTLWYTGQGTLPLVWIVGAVLIVALLIPVAIVLIVRHRRDNDDVTDSAS